MQSQLGSTLLILWDYSSVAVAMPDATATDTATAAFTLSIPYDHTKSSGLLCSGIVHVWKTGEGIPYSIHKHVHMDLEYSYSYLPIVLEWPNGFRIRNSRQEEYLKLLLFPSLMYRFHFQLEFRIPNDASPFIMYVYEYPESRIQNLLNLVNL